MSKASVFIVEDFAITRAAIIKNISDAGYALAGTAVRAEEAYDAILASRPDMVIVDINLKGNKDGLWLAKKLKEETDAGILILTALGSPRVLEKVQQIQPDAYLMKPYNAPTLITNIQLVLNNRKRVVQDTLPEEKIVFKTSKELVKLDPADILYFQSDKNYVWLVTVENKYRLRHKLTELVEVYSLPSFFIDVHRRYIVNMQRVQSYDGKSITIHKEVIPVASARKDSILGFLESTGSARVQS